MQVDAAPDMDVNLTSVEMRVARQQHIRLDRVTKILGQDQAQGVLGMGAQRVTDVELFSSDGYLHRSGRPILVRRGTSLRCWGPRRKAGNIWRVPQGVKRPPTAEQDVNISYLGRSSAAAKTSVAGVATKLGFSMILGI